MDINIDQVSQVRVTTFDKAGKELGSYKWIVHCGVEIAMDQFKKRFNLEKDWGLKSTHLNQMCSFELKGRGSMIVYINKAEIFSVFSVVNAYR